VEILAIGAHPDDIELGCGGLLLSATRNGHNVYVYTLTRGAAGGNPRQRGGEAQRAAKFLGAKALWLDDLPDSKIEEGIDLISRIESRIEAVSPDLIFTHHAGDVHHDHRTIARATLEAGRYDSNILSYEIPLTRSFEPRIFYDISAVMEDKIKLVNMYQSQSQKEYLTAGAIRGLAEYRAFQSRFKGAVNYVEAFDAAKMCLGVDFKLKKVPYDKPGIPASERLQVEISQVL
jgi:LmbE family N-acetylglucosaminyl deacetylase